MTNPPPYSRPRNAIANIIFASRWLQLPIYLGLIVVQLIYAYKFMKGLWHLLTEMDTLADSAIVIHSGHKGGTISGAQENLKHRWVSL